MTLIQMRRSTTSGSVPSSVSQGEMVLNLADKILYTCDQNGNVVATQLSGNAPLASPAFTGTPTAPVISLGASSSGGVKINGASGSITQLFDDGNGHLESQTTPLWLNGDYATDIYAAYGGGNFFLGQSGSGKTFTVNITASFGGNVSVAGVFSCSGTASFSGTTSGSVFSAQGSGGGFIASDRSTSGYGEFYRTGGVNRFWDNSYGDVITYNSSGVVSMPTLVLSSSVTASGLVTTGDGSDGYLDSRHQSAGSNYSTTVGTAQSAASATLVVASASNLAVGQFLFATNVPFPTTITAISGTTVTLSKATSAALSAGAALTFSTVGYDVGWRWDGAGYYLMRTQKGVGNAYDGARPFYWNVDANTIVIASDGALVSFGGSATFGARPTFNGQTPYDTGNLTSGQIGNILGYTPASIGQVVRTDAAQGLSAAQQAQGRSNIGLYPDNILAAASNASDFSANGSYIVAASANFTAVGPNFDVVAVLALNHQTSATTQFNFYISLYDNTAGQTVSNGQVSVCQLSSGSIALGSIPAVYGIGNLTAGHSYMMQLVTQRVQANGPTSWSVTGYGRNY